MAVFFFGEEERGRDDVEVGAAFFVAFAFPKEYDGLVVVTLLVVVFGGGANPSL